MKLLWCFTVTALLSNAFAVLDVERTIQQVQSILGSNTDLPRLSREEILELLNDIRAEDAKSKSSSTEHSQEFSKESSSANSGYSSSENEVNSTQLHDTQTTNIEDNILTDEKKNIVKIPIPITIPTMENVETTTKSEIPIPITENSETTTRNEIPIPTTENSETTTKSEPNVMVVLAYTPRDGSSLQELYTKAPRVEVMPVSKIQPKPFSSNKNLQEMLENNAKIANLKQQDFPAELQAFLDAHGLKGKPGQDNFLLPLDGFKPLPPAKVVDGNVQLPENILLSYDLITPESNLRQKGNDGEQRPVTNFMYDPLKPQYPFELDTSSSDQDMTVLPLTMPQRKKNTQTKTQNHDPFDYDAVRVIPLANGPSPIEDEKAVLESENSKRQANESTTVSINLSVNTDNSTETNTTAPLDDNKNAITNAPPVNDSVGADSDSGASIADLEDSFGGAAPEQPGDSELPPATPPRRNGFYWMLDWNSFLEVGDGDTKVNIRFEPKLGDPQMFLPVNVP